MESPCLVIRSESQRQSKYPAVVCVAAGKPFPNTHDALVYPHFDRARIKSLTRLPDGRFVALLKGVPRRWLTPGAVIVAGSEPVVRSRVGYGISLRAIPAGTYRVRGGLYREHSLPGTVSVSAVASGFHMTSSADLPLVPGASYRLFPVEEQTAAHPERRAAGAGPRPPSVPEVPAAATKGKKQLPYELLLCVPVEVGKTERKLLGPLLEQVGRTVSARRIAAVNVALLGWAFVSERVNAATVAEELGQLEPAQSLGAGANGGLLELKADGGAALVLTGACRSRLTKEIERALRRSGGEKTDAVARETGLPLELVRSVLAELERTEQVVRDSGVLIPSGPRAGLSPIEKGVLQSLRTGFESQGFVRAGKGIERRVLERLVEIRVAVRIGDRYCAMDTFEALVDRLLRGRNPGEAIELAGAREILGLPREQTVQFLELLDAKGLLRREEHLHRIVKGLRPRQ